VKGFGGSRKQICLEAGHNCFLKKAEKATTQRILDEHPLRPQFNGYYQERCDPEFEQKTAEVLCIYNEINLQNEPRKVGGTPSVITVSVDEKPGVQAIQNLGRDIMPEPSKQSRMTRTINTSVW